ncbi:hypothetical protein ABZ835_37700 [Streptomyces sp. NPDC047461]|uniref:hypothetical protein n=1 Tax=Streptomyces sp. NPDC047461 TaxID=3155619 RepID=UPI0033C17480
MSGTPPFSLAAAERNLGPDVMAKVRRLVDEAPPLRPELREQLRAVFASARAMREQPPTASTGVDERPVATDGEGEG